VRAIATLHSSGDSDPSRAVALLASVRAHACTIRTMQLHLEVLAPRCIYVFCILYHFLKMYFQAHLQTEVRYAHSNYVSKYKVSRGL
jgi:hypothetical protein